ncbi:MAG TPA: hypothetical protein VN924_06110 [Bryobacteraceae bacterium]|jgi:hypothetical protein|nr:hypothetical protein [Bryobacteraceae bacterium]
MIERRELLKTGAALVAGAALARPQSSAPPKAKIASSVMLWTLKGSFEEKLETAARAGLQSVEPPSTATNVRLLSAGRHSTLPKALRPPALLAEVMYPK